MGEEARVFLFVFVLGVVEVAACCQVLALVAVSGLDILLVAAIVVDVAAAVAAAAAVVVVAVAAA